MMVPSEATGSLVPVRRLWHPVGGRDIAATRGGAGPLPQDSPLKRLDQGASGSARLRSAPLGSARLRSAITYVILH